MWHARWVFYLIAIGVLAFYGRIALPANAAMFTTGQWAVTSTPNITTGDNVLNGVAAITPTNAWAVGQYYNGAVFQTLIEHWNGSAWSILPSPNAGINVNNYLRAISAISNTDIWAVGYYQSSGSTRTLTLHYDGTNWTVVSGPNTGTSNDILYGVAAISTGDVWAVGNSGVDSLTMHWNGTAWSVVASPNVGTVQTVLRAVSAVSSNEVWAVGYARSLYALRNSDATVIMHWNGSAWSVVPSPNPSVSAGVPQENYLYGVYAVSAADVWAAGDFGAHGGQAYGTYLGMALHWDGTSWTREDGGGAPSGYYYTYLYGVYADPSLARTVGCYGNFTLCNHTLASGPSTSSDPGSTLNALYAVSGTSSSDIWAVGSYSNGLVQQTLIEHWNGSAWSIIPSPNTGTARNTLKAVSAVSSTDVWAVGSAFSGSVSQTLTEHWNGSAWTLVPSPNPPLPTTAQYPPEKKASVPSSVLTSVVAVSSTDVWAAGYFSNSPAGSQTLVLHWDGSDWSIVSSPGESGDDYVTAISADSSSDAWAVGYAITGYSGAGNPDESPLALHWNGSSWTATNLPRPAYHSPLFAVSADSAADVWAAGSYITSSNVTDTLIEHWSSTGWSIVPSPNVGTATNQLQGIAAITPSNVWAVGYDASPGTVNHTLVEHYDGTTWSVIPSPNTASGSDSLYGVSAVTSSDIWAVGAYRSGGISHTLTLHWNGSTWAIVPSPDPSGSSSSSLTGVSAVADGSAFAVGDFYSPAGNDRTLAQVWNMNGVQGPAGTVGTTGTDSSGHRYVVVDFQNASGILAIAGTKAMNCTLAITQVNGRAFGPRDITPQGTVAGFSTFSSPYPSSVRVTVTRVDNTRSCSAALSATDPQFNTTFFDPVISPVSVGAGIPMFQTVQVSQDEHRVTITNLTPGLNQVTFVVNGTVFVASGLHDGEQRTLDLGNALRPGMNTLEIAYLGRLGASGIILFSD